MKDITCPRCGTVFQVDESDYAAIVAQVRGAEFNSEIDRRIAEVREQYKTKEETVRIIAEKDFAARLSDKNLEITRLENEITRLSGLISNYDSAKQSEISQIESRNAKELYEAVTAKEKQISQLQAELAGDYP